MHSPILAPVVALVVWSLVMLVWVYLVRMPALANVDAETRSRIGKRPGQMDGLIPDSVEWKAHNYNHLMEQPTIFYAVALALAVAGLGAGLNATLAWIYVGLRVAHSLVQSIGNVVMVRFALFGLSSIVLIVLAIRAALILIL